MFLCVCTELAHKLHEEQDKVETDINLTHVLPSHSVGHSSDQSQRDGSTLTETLTDKSQDHVPADYLTWNGMDKA